MIFTPRSVPRNFGAESVRDFSHETCSPDDAGDYFSRRGTTEVSSINIQQEIMKQITRNGRISRCGKFQQRSFVKLRLID